MKKILLFSGIALSSIFANAQVISNDDFNSSSFTPGNISSAFYPTAGQGGWQVLAGATVPNRDISNFKIETVGGRQTASILGVDAVSGAKFFLKESFKSGWDNRTEFNDVLQAEFDFYTGTPNAATSNTTIARFLGKNPTNSSQGAAIATFNMDHKDLKVSIGGFSNPCSVNPAWCPNGNEYTAGGYSYSYEEKLPANTWLKVGLAWDYNTGEVFMKVINTATGVLLIDDSIPGALANGGVDEISIITAGTAGAAVAAKSYYGSFKLEAKDEVNLLAVNDITKAKVNLTLFPNPATDFLNIDAKSKVEAVQVYDMSGKAINSSVLDNKVDVRNLSKGTYIIKVKTVEGETTQKFIKN